MDRIYNVANPDTNVWHQGVMRTASGRGPRHIKQITGFEHKFILPDDPDIPATLIDGYPREVAEEFGGGGTVFWERMAGTGGGGNVAIPPTYQAPTFSISANPTSGEVGITTNITITPSWAQRDAGPANQYRITRSGTDIHTAVTPATHIINGFQFTDAPQAIRAHVTHAAGPIKYDSLGDPHPNGQIQAGTLNSNIINILGLRRTFWFTNATPVPTPTTSDEVRAFATTGFSNLTTVNTRQIVMPFGAGTRDFIFAFPVSLGSNIDIRLSSFNMVAIPVSDTPGAIGSFIRSTVDVNDASGSNPIPYFVLHLSNAAATPSGDTYTVIIS